MVTVIVQGDRNHCLEPTSNEKSPASGRHRRRTTERRTTGERVSRHCRFLRFLKRNNSNEMVETCSHVLRVRITMGVLTPHLISSPITLTTLGRRIHVSLSLARRCVIHARGLRGFNSVCLVIVRCLGNRPVTGCLRRCPSNLRLSFIMNLIRIITDTLSCTRHRNVLRVSVGPNGVFLASSNVTGIVSFNVTEHINRGTIRRSSAVTTAPRCIDPRRLHKSRPSYHASVCSVNIIAARLLAKDIIGTPNTAVRSVTFGPRPPVANLPRPLLTILRGTATFGQSRHFSSVRRFSGTLTTTTTPFVGGRRRLEGGSKWLFGRA